MVVRLDVQFIIDLISALHWTCLVRLNVYVKFPGLAHCWDSASTDFHGSYFRFPGDVAEKLLFLISRVKLYDPRICTVSINIDCMHIRMYKQT